MVPKQWRSRGLSREGINNEFQRPSLKKKKDEDQTEYRVCIINNMPLLGRLCKVLKSLCKGKCMSLFSRSGKLFV